MKPSPPRRSAALPLLVAELALFSWETIARRSWLIAQGACSAAEYQRMALEKLTAAYLSSAALLLRPKRGLNAALMPWHRRARANARRLRNKGP